VKQNAVCILEKSSRGMDKNWSEADASKYMTGENIIRQFSPPAYKLMPPHTEDWRYEVLGAFTWEALPTPVSDSWERY
jgi:hypothetical protein